MLKAITKSIPFILVTTSASAGVFVKADYINTFDNMYSVGLGYQQDKHSVSLSYLTGSMEQSESFNMSAGNNPEYFNITDEISPQLIQLEYQYSLGQIYSVDTFVSASYAIGQSDIETQSCTENSTTPSRNGCLSKVSSTESTTYWSAHVGATKEISEQLNLSVALGFDSIDANIYEESGFSGKVTLKYSF